MSKPARRQYFDAEKNKRQRGDLYIVQILEYEQNQKNINAAKAETVVKLAKALNCTVEALMEVV